MPKIAFILPKGYEFAGNKEISDFLKNEPMMQNIRNIWSAPNLGLLTIASLTPRDWDMDYIEEMKTDIDFNAGYDIVAISCMTQQIDRGFEIASEFKKRGALTVIGGIHVTVENSEAPKYCDIVFIGEAEVSWPQFIEDYKKGVYKSVYNAQDYKPFDICTPIIPRYDLLKSSDYSTITINTSRGCNHNCSFCAASKIYGEKYRRKENCQIISEIMYIKELFPGKHILFGDDNLLISKKESKDLLRMMSSLNVRWIAQTDIAIADDHELLELMYKSGCIYVLVGLESIDENNVAMVLKWKAQRTKNYKRDIGIIQKHGIGVIGSFVFGLPYDNEKSAEKLSEFIDECNLLGIHVATPTPYPGTRYRKEMENSGKLIYKPWSKYTYWDVLIKPEFMTENKLQQCIVEIYKRFASKENIESRFRNFIKNMRQ